MVSSSPHSAAREHPAALRRLSRIGTIGALVLAMLAAAAPAYAAKKPAVVGDTVKWKGGKATLYAYVVNDPAPLANPLATKLKPGERWDSADMEVCSRTKGEFTVHPMLFHAESIERRRYGANLSQARKPSALSDLAPRECLRGWTSFIVPADEKITAMLYAGGDLASTATVARWQVPAT